MNVFSVCALGLSNIVNWGAFPLNTLADPPIFLNINFCSRTYFYCSTLYALGFLDSNVLLSLMAVLERTRVKQIMKFSTSVRHLRVTVRPQLYWGLRLSVQLLLDYSII